MAIIFEDALKKEISSSHIAPVYLLFGEDSYLKKHYCDAISNKSYSGDPFFNLQRFEGNVDLQEVYDAVNQFPMMSDKKCVVLIDYDFEHAAKSDFDRLCSLLENPYDTCVFIVRFDSIPFNSKNGSKEKKLITAAEKGGGRAVALDHRNASGLVKMLTSGAAKRGCRMQDTAARYLVETVGEDINILRSELDKLCAYAGEREIDKSTIDKVCIKSVEASVYDYVKAIMAGDISAALKMLDDMFYMRLEPMIILHTAAMNYVDIYRAHAARKAQIPMQQVAQDFGYGKRTFVLTRAADYLKKMDAKRIKLSFDALLDADKALKSFAADDRIILEKLTVKLVYIMLKGESLD